MDASTVTVPPTPTRRGTLDGINAQPCIIVDLTSDARAPISSGEGGSACRWRSVRLTAPNGRLAHLPADVDLKANRVYLEMEDLPDTAACVRVNGSFAGGSIGAPQRVNVTAQVKAGPNAIEILPRAPKSARLLVVPCK